MIGRTNTGGGGGGLNFQVIGGTTAPNNPKENIIWINTTAAITGWIFSAAEPESPTTGMVWILTGTASPAEFNALKKNSIQVCPLSAKQYVGGAWVEREAKTYQGGAWVEWLMLVYDCTTQYENTALLGADGFSVISQNPNYASKSSLSKSASGIAMNSGDSSNKLALSHVDRIDLSSYKSLHVLWSGGDNATSRDMGIGVFDVNNVYNTGTAIAFLEKTSNGEYEATLDISGIDSGFIILNAYNAELVFKKIWLE